MPVTDAFDCDSAVAACARGDASALRALYTHESPRLLGVVQRLVKNMPLAEDIVHDTFVKVWQKASTFDASRGEARGWLYTIARHQALNTLRDSQREVVVDDDTTEALDAQASMAAWHDTRDAYAWQEAAGRMGPCLEALEPVRRNCILHAYVDGLSHTEIATRVGAPLGTVKAWIKRSLAALRECLQ